MRDGHAHIKQDLSSLLMGYVEMYNSSNYRLINTRVHKFR